MNQLRQTNTWTGGMNKDVDYSLLTDSQYIHAENVRILANKGQTFGMAQDIEGLFKLSPASSVPGEKVIHVSTIRDWAIVFTKTNSANTFSVYRYDFSKDPIDPTVKKILNKLPLDLPVMEDGEYAISSVCRWESEDNVKIYWADGVNPLRVLNVDVAHDTSNASITTDSLNITPRASLNKLKFTGYGSGTLLSGQYQYAYQLFNARGSETAISTFSDAITVTKSLGNTDLQSVVGSRKKENTGKSVILSVDLNNSDFNRIRVYRVFYSGYTELPEVDIVTEFPINGTNVQFEDKGGSILSTITMDELNELLNYSFVPKILESKDDILFAANVKETVWELDEDYDARAYRSNQSGIVKIDSVTGQGTKTFNIADVATEDVPKEHDCVCPYNHDASSEYKYTPSGSGYVLGGSGKNIKYYFVTADLIEDDSTPTSAGKIAPEFSQPVSPQTLSTISLFTVNGSGERVADSNREIPMHLGLPNYANPIIASRLRGYQRDEIYRFAIVFYNEYNMPSPAKWIADIRMPAYLAQGYVPFSSNVRATVSSQQSKMSALVVHPLGIKFEVSNIPAGVTGFEIVRCERTVADRTILTQGLLSRTLTTQDSSSNELIALPFPNYSRYAMYQGYCKKSDINGFNFDIHASDSEEYFNFASPDIAVNKENSTELIARFGTIESLCLLYSDINQTKGTFGIINDRALAVSQYARASADSPTLIDISDTFIDVSSGYSFRDASGNYCMALGGREVLYTAVLGKYYLRDVKAGTATISDAKYATMVPPESFTYAEKWVTLPDKLKLFPTAIGDKVYYNASFEPKPLDVDEDSNNTYKAGPHGFAAILRIPGMNSAVPLLTNTQLTAKPVYLAAVPLCNIKQTVTPYGGVSYVSRQSSVYISTGSYQPVSVAGSSHSFSVFGGDTYINLFDYLYNAIGYNPDDFDSDNHGHKLYTGVFFPVESTINLSLRADTMTVPKTYVNGNANHFLQNDIAQISTIYSQAEPLYQYNDAYSAQTRGKLYTGRSLYDIDGLHTDNRVLYSDRKTNNEVSDSWTRFRVANYLDTDNRFGSINNMILFKNQLLFWQDDAFGTLPVNERSLITDNNMGKLTLGTGDVLSRADYLTTKNGLYRNQLDAVTQSDSTVYWYDKDRSEICSFGGSFDTLSKIKGVQSYLVKSKDQFKTRPELVYDKKYNEVLFTLDENTLVFNEQVGAMTSFYTISPDKYIEFSDKLYTFKSSDLYKYNSGEDMDLYDDKSKIAKLVFVVNKDYPYTKTFDNVEYGADVTYGTNFDNIYFKTKRQESEVVYSDMIDYREDTYKFAIPRNNAIWSPIQQVANKSYKDRMKGKYMICNYQYDCNGDKHFAVPYISTAFRHSMI